MEQQTMLPARGTRFLQFDVINVDASRPTTNLLLEAKQFPNSFPDFY